MSIGTRIKAARQAAGINQEQLAKLIGVSKGAIGNYEADISHPKEEILITLMKTLNIDANYIYQDYISTKNAPTEQVSESDFQKQRLLHNYDSLNQTGKDKLVEYSDDLKDNAKYTEKTYNIKVAARNGKFEEKTITESELEAIKNLPDVGKL